MYVPTNAPKRLRRARPNFDEPSSKRESWWARLSREVSWRMAGAVEIKVANFLQSFSIMMKNGVPIGAILEILTTQEEHPRLRHALEIVYRHVIKAGWRLSDGMKSCPDVFSPEVLLMVRTGEQTGDLAAQTLRAANLIERAESVKNKVKSALTSPLFTAGACALMIVFIVKFIMPKFIDLYSGMGGQLPLITRIVIGTVAVCNHWGFLLALAVGAVLLYLNRAWLRERIFEMAVSTPWLSGVVGSMLAAQFCESLAVMYRDGVPITRVLQMMIQSAPFQLHEKYLKQVLLTVEASGDIGTAMSRVPYFPHVVVSMGQVAEESGDMDTILSATARFMEQQNELVLAQLVAIVEPVVIAVMGVVMGFFFVGMFLPVYGMLNQL